MTNVFSQKTGSLAPLLGSEARAQVLLYLHIHREAYPRELAGELGFGLRSVQLALEQLEATRVVFSRMRGPVRVYAFNPLYPLRNELAALLGRALELLPPEERGALLAPAGRRKGNQK